MKVIFKKKYTTKPLCITNHNCDLTQMLVCNNTVYFVSNFFLPGGRIKKKEITIKTGNKRILLWGGVFRDNKKAVKHYESIGFVKLGEFVNQDGRVCFDMLMDL